MSKSSSGVMLKLIIHMATSLVPDSLLEPQAEARPSDGTI